MASEYQSVKDAIGFGISMLATEHFLSAGMSSPWSVAKFAKTDEDKQQVWKLFKEAGIASAISAAIMAWLLEDWEVLLWGLAGVAFVLVFVGSEYRRALDGNL